jgi:hypothetical protein
LGHPAAILSHSPLVLVLREMILSRGLRPPANDQDVASLISPNKRETVKSPINPMYFPTLLEQIRSAVLSSEQANGDLHKDEA